MRQLLYFYCILGPVLTTEVTTIIIGTPIGTNTASSG